MGRLCILTCLVSVTTPLYIIRAEEPKPPKERAIRIKYRGPLSGEAFSMHELSVLDGTLMFFSRQTGERSAERDAPPLPQRSLQFVWDGPPPERGTRDGTPTAGMLRATIKPIGRGVEKGIVSEKLLSKESWYVTHGNRILASPNSSGVHCLSQC